jgi:hypothetical protein
MNAFELSGYYTYRSFINNPEPVEDFNKIQFAEAELFLSVGVDGKVAGTLAFPADPLAETKAFMDITGRVVSWTSGSLELEGLGRPGTDTDSYNYKYQGSFAPSFVDAVAERPAIVGSVMRAKAHGNSAAGVTASFVAVRRDYLRPRAIPRVGLIPEAIEMLASRRHRLQHNVWHTVRMNWLALSKDAAVVAELDKRGWWPKRPPFLDNRALNLENGAGEDFLYMHRRMIQMLQMVYKAANKTAPAAWSSLPSADTPQLVYAASVDGKTFTLDADASGFMVPPPAPDDPSDQLMKSAAFFNGVMRPTQALFQSPRWLSGLTLGQLGNLVEWSIHGWMHNRWGDTIYDANGQPVGRATLFEIDAKWDDPKNDDLLDFYSSHLHPTFWRLHGWIDDRIEDWAKVHPGVKRADVDGVPWFGADGLNVLADKPFSWPAPNHHHHGNGDEDVRTMEEVTAMMEKALRPPAPGASLAKTGIATRPARLAFREALLGVSLSDLLR